MVPESRSAPGPGSPAVASTVLLSELGMQKTAAKVTSLVLG
jgi:hypothetical protein